MFALCRELSAVAPSVWYSALEFIANKTSKTMHDEIEKYSYENPKAAKSYLDDAGLDFDVSEEGERFSFSKRFLIK